MDIKTKSVLLILLIFTLGIICGFFLHNFFMEQQSGRVGIVRMGFNLSQRFDDMLELSPEQRKLINPIIIKYEGKIQYTAEKNMNFGMAFMDSMFTEIKPLLTDKQKSLLENEMEHIKNPPFPPGGFHIRVQPPQ